MILSEDFLNNQVGQLFSYLNRKTNSIPATVRILDAVMNKLSWECGGRDFTESSAALFMKRTTVQYLVNYFATTTPNWVDRVIEKSLRYER